MLQYMNSVPSNWTDFIAANFTFILKGMFMNKHHYSSFFFQNS